VRFNYSANCSSPTQIEKLNPNDAQLPLNACSIYAAAFASRDFSLFIFVSVTLESLARERRSVAILASTRLIEMIKIFSYHYCETNPIMPPLDFIRFRLSTYLLRLDIASTEARW
jgi:hypothetical protein